MKLKLPFVPSKMTLMYLVVGLVIVMFAMLLLHLFTHAFAFIGSISWVLLFALAIALPCIVIYIGKKRGI
ncbi:hypothetical protein VYA_42830 (plasmid) [Vibrio alfacsensis]|nr:hypothetical protein [Vibrio sp. 04Ya108]BBM67608.1 hypothetical protein VA249_42540 [Vibrio alfacsensis]BCN27091.1 hypothetical protein VYA_42830 [Vibrio alfacsensis]